MSESSEFSLLSERIVRQHVKPGELVSGDVVQLDPNTVMPRKYGGCFMIVETVTHWGACGYVVVPGLATRVELVPLRASYEHMVKIGHAEWKRQS